MVAMRGACQSVEHHAVHTGDVAVGDVVGRAVDHAGGRGGHHRTWAAVLQVVWSVQLHAMLCSHLAPGDKDLRQGIMLNASLIFSGMVLRDGFSRDII